MPRFIAVDGESYTDGDDHRYFLMCNSYGQTIFNEDGIPTDKCFEYLLEMPKSKGTIFVGFGFNYDVNMMLNRDMPIDQLIELKETHELEWEGFKLEWIPNKWFQVQRDGVTRRVHETYGFFQAKFTQALTDWDIPQPEQIENMKLKRSDFTLAMRQEVTDYCLEECLLLTKLMGKLDTALKAVNLRPSNWIGAGSIAAALLREKKVKDHHVYDEVFGQQAHLAILMGYFGGRVELFKQGNFPKLYDYDIVSAYPAAAVDLPSMKGASVTDHEGYKQSKYGLYLCTWKLPSEAKIMPFPVRHKGAIFYPTNGRGWYHSPEVEIALSQYPDSVTVEKSIVFHCPSKGKPFSFIPTVFKERARLKREGHPGQKALKLGLNSLYGKTAQGVGYKGKLPPFQSYYWAGYMTSKTRARALEIAFTNPDALVMIATDGIFFDEPTDVKLSKTLGGVELEELTDCFVAQPGVYSAVKENGDVYKRSRGFFAKEIDFESLSEGYEQDSFYHIASYESTRFVGLLSALHTNAIETWRTWQTKPRRLSLYPNRKFPSGHNPTHHLPPSLAVDSSQPYVPKGGTSVFPAEIDPMEFIQGNEQPMRV